MRDQKEEVEGGRGYKFISFCDLFFFLSSLMQKDIMDYSLLVGIHFVQEPDDLGSDDEGDADDYDEPRTPPLNRSTVEIPPYVADTEQRPPNQVSCSLIPLFQFFEPIMFVH